MYKYYSQGESGYGLPSTYASHPDQRDYYHIGLVISVNPLQILHCTSPTTKIDTKVGKWKVHGECAYVDYSDSVSLEDIAMEMKAYVIGGRLNVRQSKSTTSKALASLPEGTAVTVIEDDGTWAYIQYAQVKGYVMSMYLSNNGQTPSNGSDTVVVNRASLEKIYKDIAAMLGK